MERRDHVDEIEKTLRKQSFYLNPQHYLAMHPELVEEALLPPGMLPVGARESDDVPVDDLDEIDRYFEKIDEHRSMSGMDVFGRDEGWL